METMNENKVLRLRASSLPLVAACPASLDAELPVASNNPEAKLGTAVHDFLARSISGRKIDMADDAEIDQEEFQILSRVGMSCWSKLSAMFPVPEVELFLEAELGQVHLTGHCDVYSAVGDPTDGLGQIRILDWKTGREDENYEDQLRAYALIGLEANPDATSASVALVRIREQTVDWGHYTRSDLATWWNGIVSQLLNRRHTFSPGRRCGFCPRGITCPAKTAMLAQHVGTIVHIDRSEGGLTFNADELGDLLEGVKMVERECEKARELIRAHVVASGGVLPVRGGRELVITPQERRAIVYKDGKRILEEYIHPDKLAELIKIGKGDVEKAAGENAPRGKKTLAAKELIGRLEAHGAINVTTSDRLEIRRSAQLIGAKSND